MDFSNQQPWKKNVNIEYRLLQYKGLAHNVINKMGECAIGNFSTSSRTMLLQVTIY